jgi:hypothetical protein
MYTVFFPSGVASLLDFVRGGGGVTNGSATFVQWFQQLLFLIHYCCDNTIGTCATYVLASFKVKILHDNTIFTVEPR